MTGITAHMVVKNEDQWVWFAVQSTLPHVDKFLITDTGSTDKTVDVIKSIDSPKVSLKRVEVKSAEDVSLVRKEQLNETKTPWIWVIDGDEVYPNKTSQEVLKAVRSNKYEGIAVRRYDLLGDVYHRQVESVGEYDMLGEKGHLVTRLLNKDKIEGLHIKGTYPLEGYYDESGTITHERDRKNWYITKNYLYHAMYLKRSSQGRSLKSVFNRSKYKIEKGIPVRDEPPEVFSTKRPSLVPNPLQKRPYSYELAASVITPIKNLKRRLL